MSDEVATLRAENEKLAAEREQYRELYLKTLEQCRKLELGILGQKAERFHGSDQQLALAVLSQLIGGSGVLPSTDEPVEEQRKRRQRGKSTGRKPLPPELPRVEIEVVPEEVEREGRDAFDVIGEEVCETIERRAATVIVVRVRRPKFVRKDRERNAETAVVVALPPELPIERGLAGPGQLADTIVKRWQDHLPLYRLEQIYARDGLELARSTIGGWHMALGELIRPLVDAMWVDARGAPYLCTDATGVLVQAKEECRRGHFWVVVVPHRHVLYRYTAEHTAAAVDSFLEGYEGFLVADAHVVYDHLYHTGKVFEVGCWAHLRRYWYKALDSDVARARQALTLIRELFKIESRVADGKPHERLAVRQRESVTIVDAFFAWGDAEAEHALPDTPVARALTYARNQRVALRRFLTDGRLPIHNNSSENALRREVLGRKNWLFLGNDDAGEVNAMFVTLLASCQLHRIEPWAYLRDLFCLLPSWPAKRVLELAPVHWKQTLEQSDAQQRLAANVFRRAVLELDVHPTQP